MSLGGQNGMTLARARNFLQLSGADKEACGIVNVAGVKIDSDREGYTRVVDVTKLREDLILKLERERSDQVVRLRAKQKQIMVDKEGREAELLELQKAEEAHRELLLKDRDERNKIAKDLHSLRRGHLVDMEEETRRELSALQRERELLQAKEKENIDAIDEVRRQIMEQDEVYHRAMDEAGRKIQDGKGGVDKDGRPLADAAKRQRQAIQAEQVALAESYGKRAGALKEEQAKLQRELKDVKGRVRKIGKEATGPAKGAEDALAALMTEAGMEEQAARLRKLKVNFEKEHAEAVSGGYIKDYEGAEAATRKAVRNGDRLLEGRTGEYAEATADAFLDDWLKTDAERVRDAAAAAAAAANSPSSTSSSTTSSTPRKPPAGVPSLPLDGTKNRSGVRLPREDAGRDRGLDNSAQNGAATAGHSKKKRHGHHHDDRSHNGAQRGQHGNGPETDGVGDRYADERGNYESSPPTRKNSSDEYDKRAERARGDVAAHGRYGSGGDAGGGDGSGGRGGRNGSKGKRSGNQGDTRGPREGGVGAKGTGAHAQRPHSGQGGEESHPRRRNAVILPAVGSPDLRGGTQSAEHLHRDSRDDNTGQTTPSTGRRRARSGETGGGNGAERPRTGYAASQPERGGRPGALGQANDDAARLRATVERLETELNSVKCGMGAGGGGLSVDGFGMGRGHGGVPFGAAAQAGSQWTAAPGMQQYIASLDAENARMMVELQGLSAMGAGLGGGNLGLLGSMGGAAAGSASVFPGVGLALGGGGGAGYAPQMLQGTDRVREEEGEGMGNFRGQGSRDGRGKVGRKRSEAPRGEEDAAGLGRGGGGGGEPLSPRNREYRLKMVEMDAEHKEAVKRLEFEMQRLELEQQLEDMRERMAREKKTRQQDVAHEQWVTEQKRNLQAIKIEKTLAKERQLMEVQQTLSGGRPGGGAQSMYVAAGGRSTNGGPEYGGEARTVQGVGGWRPGVGGIMQRPYNQDRGFCVFWDYILGLPKRSGSKVIGKVRLAFGLYVGKRLHGKMLSTQWADIARSTVKHEATGKVESCALLETRNIFAGIPLNVQTKLVVELQFKDSAGVQGKGGKDNLGWGCIHVFKSEKHNPQRLTVRAGLTRLTLFPGNVDLRIANVNDDRSALSRSTPMAAFIRLVHGEDMNAAAAFVVDPDTHQLYGAYGRGHLPQMDRQKLMTGTFLRVLLVLAKFKRSLVSRTSAKALGASAAGGMKEHARPLKTSGRPGSSLLSRPAAFASPRADKPAAVKDDAVQRMPNAGDNDTDDGENQEADTISAAEDSEALEGRDDLSLGNQTSLGEETASQTADGSVEGTESVVSERRRSSLASLQSQIATQKTMARRASLTKRRESTASRQPFLKGDGFDLYIDLGGGMPYPCTVSKVVVRVVGNAGEQRGSEASAISEGDSLSNTPVFRLRQEYRTDPDERMDMMSTAMIRVDTLDRFSSEHRAVGYALVAVFMDPQGNQPTNSSADGVFLREGNYQVPLYQRPPPDMRRLTSKSLDKFTRVPCASVMVRVKPAPKSSAGKTLSTADVPLEEWKTFGLMIPMPEFAPGVYDNSALQLTDLEREVLELRSQDREQEMVEQAAELVEPPENPAPEYRSSSGQEAFKEWAEALMEKKPKKMIEYQRSEKYRADRGFSVTVAGLINMKPAGAFKSPKLYKVIYSLFMPGLYYLGDPPLSDQGEFTLSYDPRSPQSAPRFKDPPHDFRSQKINQSQFVIVDVRFLKVEAKEVATVPEEPSVAPASGAWGLLPVFSNGDVATGSFVVPLLSGPVPPAILNTENPLRFMTEKIKMKHPNFRVLEGSSVVVQICNALLQNVLPLGTQDPNLNYIYVKRITDAAGAQQEKYAFEYIADAGTKSVGRVVPKTFKDRHDAFFHLANKHLADATGMTHVLRRGAAKAR